MVPWHTVARRAARAFHDKTLVFDKELEAVLQGPARWRGLQRIFNLTRSHAFRMGPRRFLDHLQMLFLNSPCHLGSLYCAKNMHVI